MFSIFVLISFISGINKKLYKFTLHCSNFNISLKSFLILSHVDIFSFNLIGIESLRKSLMKLLMVFDISFSVQINFDFL